MTDYNPADICTMGLLAHKNCSCRHCSLICPIILPITEPNRMQRLRFPRSAWECNILYRSDFTDMWHVACRHQLQIQWSPAGTHLLCILPFEVGIYKPDGTRYPLELPNSASISSDGLRIDLDGSWSPSGKYVLLQTLSRRAGEGPYSFNGCLWDVEAEKVALRWGFEHAHNLESGIAMCPFLWVTASKCIVTACHMLVSLPANADQDGIIPIPLDRQTLTGDLSRLRVSRDGKLLVGQRYLELNYDKTAYLTADPARDNLWVGLLDTLHPHIKATHPHILWHAELNMDQPFCGTIVVQAMQQACLMDSMAWHPSPALAGMYAIADESGNVWLVDGKRHRIIRKWSLAELCEGFKPQEHPRTSLSWSADGTMLIVAGDARLSIVRFGVQDMDDSSSES